MSARLRLFLLFLIFSWSASLGVVQTALAQDNLGAFHSKHFLFGAPAGTPATNDLIIRDSYALSNNRETKFADWVAYRLTPQEVSGTVDLNRTWRADPWLAEDETLEPSGPDDYKGASKAEGYQRGHQAPLASFKGSHAARELNYFSNITPQFADLNAGPWARLEELVRDYVRRWETVWVMTGPLYESPMPPLPSADETHTVPSGYWKIIVDWDGGDVSVAAFIMTQDVARNAAVRSFTVSVSEVEERSGLSFFEELSGESRNAFAAGTAVDWLIEQ